MLLKQYIMISFLPLSIQIEGILSRVYHSPELKCANIQHTIILISWV